MREPIQVGSIKAEPGRKAQGFLHVANRGDGTAVQLPIIVVNGVNDGPVVSIVAGIHGDEYESMIAAAKFARGVDPKELKGAIIGVPIVNTPAFDAGTRVSPTDHMNLNRIFPGKKEGFISERIAFTLTDEVIRKSYCFIDLHSGGNILGIGPLASLEGQGEEALMLAKAWGLELIWKSEPIKGLTTTAALENGVRASLVEIGGESRFRQESVNTFLSGLINVLKYLGALDGEPVFRAKYTLADGDFVSCNSGGFYIAEKKVHDIVNKGETIGRIYDPFNQEIEIVPAPIDGIILSIRTYPKVSPGDWVVCIGKVSYV